MVKTIDLSHSVRMFHIFTSNHLEKKGVSAQYYPNDWQRSL